MQHFDASFSTVRTVFTSFYDGIYHFVAQPPNSGTFYAENSSGGLGQTVVVQSQPAAAHNQGSGQFTLLLAAGDKLKQIGDAFDLYGYRTSDEL